MISVVIPIYNEHDNIDPLYEKLANELPLLNRDFEVIFVNDGSNDLSEAGLNKVTHKDRRFKVLNLRRNYGQTAAMMAGIDYAKVNNNSNGW
jgi:Glycosyltransferases involved in cell wall biogenesis